MSAVKIRFSTVAVLLMLCPTGTFAQSRDPLPVPDVPGFRTLKCDFHLHTVFSDGEVWPVTRVDEAWRDGLDAIALTDHSGHNPHKPDVSADLSRPFDIARQHAVRLGLILIPGVEVMEGNAHFNLLYVSDPNAFLGLKMLPALRAAARQKAFAFWNHPGWKETPRWSEMIAQAHSESLFRGVELVNGPSYYPEVFGFVNERNLTILANSDVHAPVQSEYDKRTRPVTLVFARTRDDAGIRDALDSGRTIAWMNGQLWGRAELLTELWKASVSGQSARLSFADTVRRAALRIANRSAIPFQVRIVKTPPWLFCGEASLGAEREAALPVSLAKDTPTGRHEVGIEAEIMNLHPAHGENLRVRLSLEVDIK